MSGVTATFTPASGFLPGTKVTVKIPGGAAGMTGADPTAGALAEGSTVKFKTGTYATLRLQQLLAELGYLPLTWAPSGSGSADDGGSASIPADAPAALAASVGASAANTSAPSTSAPSTSAADTSSAGSSSGTVSLNEQVADAHQPCHAARSPSSRATPPS